MDPNSPDVYLVSGVIFAISMLCAVVLDYFERDFRGKRARKPTPATQAKQD